MLKLSKFKIKEFNDGTFKVYELSFIFLIPLYYEDRKLGRYGFEEVKYNSIEEAKEKIESIKKSRIMFKENVKNYNDRKKTIKTTNSYYLN